MQIHVILTCRQVKMRLGVGDKLQKVEFIINMKNQIDYIYPNNNQKYMMMCYMINSRELICIVY